MTHIVHPYAHRLGIIRDWKSRWFAASKKNYRENIKIDETIRRFLTKCLRGAYVSNIEIERSASELRIIVSTARPGIVIGRSGENASNLRKELTNVVRATAPNDTRTLKLDIVEIRQPEADAAVVTAMVIESLEKRLPFRRVLKSTAEKVIAARGIEGVRIALSGRLGGAEMSRKEEVKKGRIPLQTFRANIDYACDRALLPYGTIGVKVWIYHGTVDESQQRHRAPSI